MAIVFPASPSVNETFTAGSITYKWDGSKWIGLGVTPADRLVEGSNSLEIDASNNLSWTGNNVQIGPTTATSKLTISSTTTGTFDALNIASGLTSTNGYQVGIASTGNVFHWNTTDSWMNFATNNVERFRITEDGDLIINNNLTPTHSVQTGSIFLTKPSEQTANPSRGLCWSTTSDTHYVKLEPTVIDGLVLNGYSGVAFATGSRTNSTWTERARIDGSGLYVSHAVLTDEIYSYSLSNDDATSHIDFRPRNAAGGSSIQLRIGVSGNILIGEATSTGVGNYSGGLAISDTYSGSTYMRIGHDLTGAEYSYIVFAHNAGGNSDIGRIHQNSAGTAVTYLGTSDYRAKENVTPLTGAISRLNQLKPINFNWIADPDNAVVDGFLAHEVQEIVPEAVGGEKDAVDDDGNPIYQGIDPGKMVPLLTAALQEALAEIETLKGRLDAAGL